MEKMRIELPSMQLVGLTVRTNNAAEKDPTTAKITPIIQRYFQQGISDKIQHRVKPGVLYCVYTNYESDVNGDYTYFVGEMVNALDNVAPECETLTIPAQQYVKFTNGPDKMPDVCIKAWQNIWGMTAAELSGERAYIADFEVYDERSYDPHRAVLDIYIGIK